jgi:dihydroxyacetone kinase
MKDHRIIIRADIDDLKAQNKVTLLSGGGSGHEPAHAGYVGRGMLTGAVAGSVFASPPPDSILAALRAISSPAGSLMIVKNYTGDRLNFGIAAERARNEGMKVAMVIVGEDTALPSDNKSAGRRGLCGTIFVHKIAGALAEKGHSLDEVLAAAQEVANDIATMSVSLSPCALPGHKASFSLGEDEMELGLGIHGEAGTQRIQVQPADKVVARLLDHMTSQEPGYQYFNVPAGSDVALMVNNLGGTSNLELSLVAGRAIDYLTNKLQYNVRRSYMGSFMTSLEMAGVSLTLLKMSSRWAECLDEHTNAPGWPNVSLGPTGSPERVDLPPIKAKATDKRLMTCESIPKTTRGALMMDCLRTICNDLIASEESLNQLDRGSGDGDCGSTLKSGSLGYIIPLTY